MNGNKFEKASLGSEDGISCDSCGAIVDRSQVTSVYIGDKGQKVDYCLTCFNREGVAKRD